MANIKRVNLPHSNPNQMKKLSWLLACFFTITLSAQEKLVVMGKTPNLYILHRADGKESLHGISSLFGQSVGRLAAYNGIKATTVLAKGTAVKIPVSKDNIIQQKTENIAPLYHAIQKGDNLYRISQAYYKIPISTLKEWNNMKNDVVKNGQLLIIGYMVNAPVVTENNPEPKPEPGKDIPAINNTTQPNATVPGKKNSEKSVPPVPKPVANDPTRVIRNGQVSKGTRPNTEEKPQVNEVQPVVKIPVTKPEEKPDYTPKEGDEGYFAALYAQHPREQAQQFRSGDAAVFKTISGWTDRKYYVLMNDVASRTMVRVTGPNSKSICAMVLGPLQETKGASGLLLRISNSAASALGITDAKFTLTITYFE